MGADTEWTEAGSTAGKPDRYQSRTYRGCFLSAGANGRKPSGAYERSDAPWWCSIEVHDREAGLRVHAELPGSRISPDAPGLQVWTLWLDGAEEHQDAARTKAENAALLLSGLMKEASHAR